MRAFLEAPDSATLQKKLGQSWDWDRGRVICCVATLQNAGVCPVSGLLGMPRTSTGNTAQLVTCARSPGNLVTVTYTRPLKASNR